jgi:hypothetical protein
MHHHVTEEQESIGLRRFRLLSFLSQGKARGGIDQASQEKASNVTSIRYIDEIVRIRRPDILLPFQSGSYICASLIAFVFYATTSYHLAAVFLPLFLPRLSMLYPCARGK